MQTTYIHKTIAGIMSLFYYIGIWYRGDKPTTKDITFKVFHCIFYATFPLSLGLGAIQHDKLGQSLLLGQLTVGTSVASLKFLILVWKQTEVEDLLRRVCVFAIEDSDNYAMFNGEVEKFAQLLWAYMFVEFGGNLLTYFMPYIGSEPALLYDIAFPLDWKNDDTAFYLASLFNSIQGFMSVVISLFTAIIWYLLFVCSMRYEVLGSVLRNMGHKKGLKAEQEEDRVAKYRNDLHTCIDTHLNLTELTLEVGDYFSRVFLIVLATSSVCICLSTYSLAIGMAESLVEQSFFVVISFHFLCDIFFITYFGNEVTLSYSRLPYRLFESNWIDASQSSRKCVIIFGEYLQPPLMLMIGKLYPLTLETFTSIMDSAYSLFNILIGAQQN